MSSGVIAASVLSPRSVVSMGVHHGIGVASWKMIASLGSIFAFNMGALTFFDFEKDRLFYLFALMSLLGMTAVFIWRKMRRKAFVQSVIDLPGLRDDWNGKVRQELLFKATKLLSKELVHLSVPNARCRLDEFKIKDFNNALILFPRNKPPATEFIRAVSLVDFGDLISQMTDHIIEKETNGGVK